VALSRPLSLESLKNPMDSHTQLQKLVDYEMKRGGGAHTSSIEQVNNTNNEMIKGERSIETTGLATPERELKRIGLS
jgi:hypothetical protein